MKASSPRKTFLMDFAKWIFSAWKLTREFPKFYNSQKILYKKSKCLRRMYSLQRVCFA